MNIISAKKARNNILFSEFILTPEEDAAFMSNIDMEALENGVKKSEQEIAIGLGIELGEAMAQIRREVFGEDI